MLDRYQVGDTVQAWADPIGLDGSFLDHKATFFPYLFLLLPMIFFALGAGMTIGAFSKNKTDPVAGDRHSGTEGWFIFKPEATTSARLKGAIASAAIWNGMGVLAMTHFMIVGTGLDKMSIIALSIYFGLGMIPVWTAAHRLRVGQLLHDASLLLETDRLTRGQNTLAFVEQFIKSGCRINAFKLGLKCERTRRERSGGKTRFVTKTLHEETHPLASNQDVTGTDALHLGHTLQAPADHPASTEGNGYPRVRWSVTVHTDIANAPDYQAKFPVKVV